MAITATGYIDQVKLASEIEWVKQLLGPKVVYGTYRIGPNLHDDPSLHLRIVLTDEASREAVLFKIASRMKDALFSELHDRELGPHSVLQLS